MPLQRLETLWQPVHPDALGAKFRHLNIKNSNLGTLAWSDFAAQCLGQQLMPQAQPQKRHPAPFDRLFDQRFFCDEPRIVVLLPNIHRTAHGPDRIIAIQGRQRLALIQLNRVPTMAVLGQEVTKDSGVFHADMLQDQDVHFHSYDDSGRT